VVNIAILIEAAIDNYPEVFIARLGAEGKFSRREVNR